MDRDRSLVVDAWRPCGRFGAEAKQPGESNASLAPLDGSAALGGAGHHIEHCDPQRGLAARRRSAPVRVEYGPRQRTCVVLLLWVDANIEDTRRYCDRDG
jgi:hypothetical protein